VIIKYVEDGIEFYTKESTGESGMSESGLARICDVAQQTAHDLLQEMATGKWRSSCLKAVAGKDLWLQGKAPDNAKVVRDEVCAAVIEHYSFEARKKTERALFAYRKFAAKGVRTWIQGITGWESKRKERIVRAIVSGVHSSWQKRFEDEFFEEAYRVTGWQPPSSGHPPCMAQFINETIYSYFPEGTQERLNLVNPRVDGRRKRKQHQHLTPELGTPVLESQKAAVYAVMRLSPSSNRDKFRQNMQKALSNVVQIELPFVEDNQAS
jgi:hypothetical protein